MTALTPEEIDHIREEIREGELGWDSDLLAHVDHLTAENARLREGIAALAETGEADGRGNSRDLARHLRALLNPPTEGEAP